MEWLGYLAVIVTVILGTINMAERLERAVETKVEFVLDKWGLIDTRSDPKEMYPNGSATLQASLSAIYEQAKANQKTTQALGQATLDQVTEHHHD